MLSMLNMSVEASQCRMLLDRHPELVNRVLSSFFMGPSTSVSSLAAKNYKAFADTIAFYC